MNAVLIANRGEIACRVIRACRTVGLRAIAVYADPDQNAPHVRLADEAFRVGPAPAAESYLNVDAILTAARRGNADAVHPGYGFLAENGDFAAAVQETGMVWIGPPPPAMRLMGNKQAARAKAAEIGVPVVPGYGGAEQSDGRFVAEAARLGYPLLVKAAAGGGGKGMRRVERRSDLEEALAAARREARQAFGSDELLLEKALAEPRHVEVQILADGDGQTIALGERECSIQRRYQKIVEESPAPGLSDELRRRLSSAAVALAQAVGYVNAGTVEFLVAGNDFYFLEMNTRLQVEHPVTEMVYGMDLVAWQLRIGMGERLDAEVRQAQPAGHAIEARLYAEDTGRDFLPTSGTAGCWYAPTLPGARIDHGLREGMPVTIHYDPLLAKIIAHGPDRPGALRRLRRALEQTILLGVVTNRAFLLDIVGHPDVTAGAVNTRWLGRAAETSRSDVLPVWPLAAAALLRWQTLPQRAENAGYWRAGGGAGTRFQFEIGGVSWAVGVEPAGADAYRLTVGDETLDVRFLAVETSAITLIVNGHRRTLPLYRQADRLWIHTAARDWIVDFLPLWPEPQPVAAGGGSLRAPMPGSVTAVLVQAGDPVKKGQPLLILEAMKMEHTIRSAADGVVERVFYAAGDTVEADARLVAIQAG